MIKEYDIVKSLIDLNQKVLKDCKGTVLIVHPDFPPAYEVEFVDNAFETIDVLTVKADDIIKIEQ
jgi:hypothetical protein